MTWTAPPVDGRHTLGTGSERELLESWLDTHRRTLLWKCSGLTAEQLRRQADPPSPITLIGLVRHAADNERWWFTHHAAGRPLVDLFGTEADPGDDVSTLSDADVAADLSTFEAECQASREVTAGLSLDHQVRSPSGRMISVRWIFLHMIEEYARHNGHADLLREHLDGATGDFAPVAP
jgi:hypothetical protein